MFRDADVWMLKMKKEMLTLSIGLVLFFLSIGGCIEQSPSALSIQNLIDNASEGEIIYIDSGVYYGNITLNKSITLIGENRETTIINGSGNVVVITADNCTFQGFTVINRNSSEDTTGIKIHSSHNLITNNIISNHRWGIYLQLRTNNNTVLGNEISNNQHGIYLIYSSTNNISKNNISLNKLNGIGVESQSKNNVFSDNKISYNLQGMHLAASFNNKAFDNNISDNQIGIDICCASKNNLVYNNKFVHNSQQNAIDLCNNSWDDGAYGNYWDNYTGVDNDDDGIGDTPYNISGYGNQDRYPLINPR